MQNSVIDFILSKDLGLHEKIEFNEKFKEYSRIAGKYYERLGGMLNDEQKDIFLKFVEADTDERCEGFDIYFRAGLKFGLRLAIECLGD